jgi:hypothetical protein
MKLLLSLFFASALFTAQAQDTPVEYTSYGDAITVNGALSVDEFSKATASSDSLTAKLKAEILEAAARKAAG